MTIQESAQSHTALAAAIGYVEAGCSVIPVSGKKPAISWARYQAYRTPYSHIHQWSQTGKLFGVGIVCGWVSNNLVVIDLDGMQAVQTFMKQFPELLDTFIVTSGSGEGKHLYYRTIQSTVTTRTKTDTGGFELRSDGCYVVAPPSLHPSGNPYVVHNDTDVMVLDNLDNVRTWIMDMIRAKQPAISPAQNIPINSGQNPRWVQAAISRELSRLSSTIEGNANNTLNAVAYRLARICANPHSGLIESNIKADILEAAQHLTNRDGLRATLATIESGWNAGIKSPAHIPEPRHGRNNV